MSLMIVSSAHALDVVLMDRVPETGRALFEAHGVDAGKPLQMESEALLREVGTDEVHRTLGRG